MNGLCDQHDAHVVLSLYRLLAEGKPVSVQRLAARAGRSVREIAEWLRGADRAELDDTGAVVAFQGFSLRPTQHLVEVDDGGTFYAGCAADTLFIPEAIGRSMRVRSTDPITGTTVSLSLDDDGSIRELEPATAVLSMAVPGTAIEDVAIPAACGPINFFSSPKSGSEFTTGVEGAFLLTIGQGVELARQINHTAFGSALQR